MNSKHTKIKTIMSLLCSLAIIPAAVIPVGAVANNQVANNVLFANVANTKLKSLATMTDKEDNVNLIIESSQPVNTNTISEKIADFSQKYETVKKYLYVVNNDVKIYTEDNTKSKIVKKANKDDYFYCEEKDANNKKGFCKIKYNKDSYGYISLLDISFDIHFKSVDNTYYAKKDLKVYKEADTNSKEVKNYKETQAVKIIGSSAELYKIKYENDKIGYVSKKNLSKDLVFKENKKTVYTKEEATLYKEPSTKSDEYGTASKNCKLQQIEYADNWIKIKYNDDVFYIKSDKTSTKKASSARVVSLGDKKLYDDSSYIGNKVVNYAYNFVGVLPYVWGGTSLTSGADCSGFICALYDTYGYNFWGNRTSLFNVGYSVSLDEALPGDIVVYPGHVALYAGNGMVIHAASEQWGTVHTDISWSGQYTDIRHVV